MIHLFSLFSIDKCRCVTSKASALLSGKLIVSPTLKGQKETDAASEFKFNALKTACVFSPIMKTVVVFSMGSPFQKMGGWHFPFYAIGITRLFREAS